MFTVDNQPCKVKQVRGALCCGQADCCGPASLGGVPADKLQRISNHPNSASHEYIKDYFEGYSIAVWSSQKGHASINRGGWSGPAVRLHEHDLLAELKF